MEIKAVICNVHLFFYFLIISVLNVQCTMTVISDTSNDASNQFL